MAAWRGSACAGLCDRPGQGLEGDRDVPGRFHTCPPCLISGYEVGWGVVLHISDSRAK